MDRYLIRFCPSTGGPQWCLGIWNQFGASLSKTYHWTKWGAKHTLRKWARHNGPVVARDGDF